MPYSISVILTATLPSGGNSFDAQQADENQVGETIIVKVAVLMDTVQIGSAVAISQQKSDGGKQVG